MTNTTKGKLPSLPFDTFAKKILGKDYDLSLVFVDSKKMRQLNAWYRNIKKPTDILSFPLSKKSGEIFISLSETRRMAPEFGMTFKKFLPYLFIHGLLHLRGLNHGATMERLEKKYQKLFKV